MNICKYLFIVFLFIATAVFSQTTKVDSLKKRLNAKTDTNQVNLLINVSREYMEISPNEGLKYANESLKKSKALGFERGLVYSCNIKGICYDVLGSYDSSLYYYKAALNISSKGNEIFIGGVYNNIGLIYWNTDNYPEALKSFNMALFLLKESKNVHFKSSVTNNIGLIYHDIKDYELSNSYFKKAIQLELENKDTVSAVPFIINLAINYYETKRYSDCKKMFDDNYKYLNQLNEYYRSEFLINKATLEINTQTTSSTEKDLQAALVLKENMGHTIGVTNAYIQQSELYRKNKNFNGAITASYKALKLTEELKALKKLQDVYENLFVNYLEINKKDSAIKYSDLYKQTIDSVYAENRAKAFSKEQVAFKTFEKEKENLELVIQNTNIQAKNKLIILSSIALIILVIIFVWIFLYRKKQINIKKQIELINNAVVETEQIERERIARDLHDGVGQKLSVVKMQLSLKNADVKTASNLLDDAIQDVRTVSHNLLPSDLSKGLINALEAMCLQINNSSSTLALNLKISDSVKLLNIDKQHTILIYRMIQELINNAIKYSLAKNININMDCEKNQLKLFLIDDGVGFDTTTLDKKDGMGIKNINKRINQLIGSIQLKSDIGKGTQYKISIPI